MSELLSEYESVKEDIVTTKADLANAKQGGNENLVLMYGNILLNLYQKEQRLENSGIVLNLKAIYLYSCCLNLWYIICGRIWLSLVEYILNRGLDLSLWALALFLDIAFVFYDDVNIVISAPAGELIYVSLLFYFFCRFQLKICLFGLF